MKTIVKSNNHFVKKTLVGLGGAEAWIKNYMYMLLMRMLVFQ